MGNFNSLTLQKAAVDRLHLRKETRFSNTSVTYNVTNSSTFIAKRSVDLESLVDHSPSDWHLLFKWLWEQDCTIFSPSPRIISSGLSSSSSSSSSSSFFTSFEILHGTHTLWSSPYRGHSAPPVILCFHGQTARRAIIRIISFTHPYLSRKGYSRRRIFNSWHLLVSSSFAVHLCHVSFLAPLFLQYFHDMTPLVTISRQSRDWRSKPFMQPYDILHLLMRSYTFVESLLQPYDILHLRMTSYTYMTERDIERETLENVKINSCP